MGWSQVYCRCIRSMTKLLKLMGTRVHAGSMGLVVVCLYTFTCDSPLPISGIWNLFHLYLSTNTWIGPEYCIKDKNNRKPWWVLDFQQRSFSILIEWCNWILWNKSSCDRDRSQNGGKGTKIQLWIKLVMWRQVESRSRNKTFLGSKAFRNHDNPKRNSTEN